MPALLRTGFRIRFRRALVLGRARRRRVDLQRPEGLDDARPPGAVGPPRGAHRSAGGEARRTHRVRRRHAGTDRRGATPAPTDGRGRVQRGLLLRHARPRQRTPRRAGRRMARVTHDADERAGLDRGHDPAEGFGHDRHPDRRVERAPRRPARCEYARRGDEAVEPRRGAAPHQPPRQSDAQDGRPGSGGFDRQDGIGRPQQGHLREGRRHAGR